MSKSSHRVEFRIAVIAGLALFFAQWGALAHAYTHQPATAYQQTLKSHDFCNDCLNFAPSLAPGGTPTAAPFALQHGQSAPPAPPPASFLDRRTYLAFRSRAPPVLG
ncbi:MAG: hypothetical protein M3N91_15390 [Pseudomonadota bacterium]|nr:hypothetical protein [Pseudomonadota bacterium]